MWKYLKKEALRKVFVLLFVLISGFFDASIFSQTVLHFRNIKLIKRCSYFMYLYLYLSDLYEKVPKKSKN